MESELNELKKILRSLVVSSPTPVDVCTLQKDYKNMVGCHIPVSKFGYKDVLSFVKSSCQDCFVIGGNPYNPILTLIVPDTLQHINNLVSRQTLDRKDKFKGKRKSLQQHQVRSTLLPSPRPAAETVQRPAPAPQCLAPVTVQRPAPAPQCLAPVTVQRPAPAPQCLAPVTVQRPAPAPQRSNPSPRRSLQPYVSCSDVSSGSSGQSSQSGEDGGHCPLMELERRVVELMTRHDGAGDGLLLSTVETLYRDEHGHQLPYRGHGARPATVLRRLPRLVLMREHTEWRVWLADCMRAEAALPGVPDETPPPPPDCLSRGEAPPSVNAVTADLCIRDKIELSVAEVYSPTLFWVQRRGSEYLTALEDLMTLMNEHYARATTVLGGGSVLPGQYCAATYGRDWHRAVVLTPPGPDSCVKVRYVDYGTVERVSCGRLRPLPRVFAELPVQAVRARLYGLRPPGGDSRWDPVHTAAFLNMVRERPLMADLVTLDIAENVLEILLVDTSTAQDICLNMELLDAHHAERRGTDDHNCEYLRRPAFEDLESGRALSFTEIVALRRAGLSEESEPAYVNYAPRPTQPFCRAASLTGPTDSPAPLTRLEPLGQSSLAVDQPCVSGPPVVLLSQVDCMMFLHVQQDRPQLALKFMLNKVQQALDNRALCSVL